MRFTPCVAAAMTLLLWSNSGRGQGDTSRLLPTLQPARTIRAIQTDLRTYSPNARWELEKVRHERRFRMLRDEVSKFIAAQLDAYPKIPPPLLREQLIRILNVKRDGQNDNQSKDAPYVFRASDDSGLERWTVVYGDAEYSGLGGSRIVVESYVVEQGKARLAGRAGSEMDGMALNAELIGCSQNSLLVLLHGIITWTSGRDLPARAAIYNSTAGGVHALWRLDAPGFQFIGASCGVFVIGYHDEDREVVDMYVLPDPIGKPKRVSHIYPDELRRSAQ